MEQVSNEDILANVRRNKQTFRLVARVAEKIKQDKDRGTITVPVFNYLARAEELTGLVKEYLVTLDGKPITKFQELDWRFVHGALDIFYAGEQILPTTKQLFDSLYGNIPKHIDIRTFRVLLLKMGFVWKRISVSDGSQRLVIIERPKLRFERFNYLNMISQYRSDKNILFVSETLVRCNNETLSVEYCNLSHLNIQELIEGENVKYLYILCAVALDGIYCYSTYDQFHPGIFKDWLCDNFKEFKKPSVFIFSGGDYKDRDIIKIPKENGIKIDMMEWLDYHSIPYDPNMSKHDLWALVTKFTNTFDKIYEIDSVLKLSGHSVLRIPDLLKQLTPAYLLYKTVANNLYDELFESPEYNTDQWQENWSACVKNVIVSIDKEMLEKFHEEVVSEEAFLLNKEKRLDLNLEKLFEQTKFSTYEPPYYDSDLPSWSDDD